MNSTLNMLLRLAISHGLSNREEFVDKVGAFLQDKMGKDEATADKYGEYIVNLLENYSDRLLLEQIIKSSQSDANAKLEKKIDELTHIIEELNKKIDSNSK